MGLGLGLRLRLGLAYQHPYPSTDAHRVGALNQHLLAEGHARGQSGFALSDIFVSTTLGARIADLNVSSSANAEFAATLIFVAYLVRVRVRVRGRGRDRDRVRVRVRVGVSRLLRDVACLRAGARRGDARHEAARRCT